MGKIAKIAISALLLLLVLLIFVSGSPQYFSCSGTKTANGSEQTQRVTALSFKTEMVPWLNDIILSPKYLGTAAFDSHQLYLHIFSVSDVNVMMKSASGGRALGVFDRVSRRLTLNDGSYGYDLICRTTDSVEI